ncbi:2-phosphosulfolactate phosphatase [Patescibacteria group bacterium]|nr:MAG: 2-phosphosulfolactate phosphatase [Patescibacteria group bacterium]
MLIEIKKYIAGAKEADGIAVIFDIFRASNTIIACLASGAEYVIPVGEPEEVYRLKEENPDSLLFGERGGLMLAGFDYGNSPAEAAVMDLRGKKVIITTSAGSQGIVNASRADEVLIGSFSNAEAIINYIRAKNPAKVSLLAMGEGGTRPAIEDELCAKYVKAKLENDEVDFDQMKAEIMGSDGANRLKKLNQERDLEFGLKLNIYKVIPKLNKMTNKIASCDY